jgi:SAM-dependent methyltransferase
MVNEPNFKDYSYYYDLINSDKDYLKETKYILDIFKKNGLNKGDILEFGCGTGMHANLISKFGFNVHGVELSEHMVKNSKTNSRFTCEQGDIALVNMKRKYNAVIALFHVINYQVKNKQLNLVFKNASKHLEKDGLFIFDFWFGPAVRAQKPSIRVKRFEDKIFKITRIAEPKIHTNTNKVDVNYSFFIENLFDKSIKSFEEKHTLRYFDLLEIEKISSKYNFKIIKFEEFLKKSTLSDKTWSACAIMKRI